MKTICTSMVLGLGLVLAGCASAPTQTGTAAAPQQYGVAHTTGPIETGSRLVRRTTDRSVRVIDNAAAVEDSHGMQSIGNTVGARGN